MPDVLVVIPVYNRHRLVLDCLDAVAAQTLPAAEVVVSDDGSTDSTVDAVRGWIADHAGAPPCRLVASGHAGASAARMRGFRAGGAHRFVAFLDSDDLWPADFLARVCPALERDPGAVAATTDIRTLRPRRPEILRSTGRLATAPIREIFRSAGLASATVCRREAVQRAGGWDERASTGEDAALFLRIARLGRWLHVPGTPVVKRQDFHSRGEARHMYQDEPDHKRLWAEIYDKYATRHDLGAPFPGLVARHWFRAGKSARLRGDPRQARSCLRRGLAWRPVSPRLWWEFARSYLSRERR